jgi:hypothetical protein
MNPIRRGLPGRLSLPVLLVCAAAGGAFAQQGGNAVTSSPGGLGTDPERFASASGMVQQFTRAPTGAVDGFVLDEGTTVHFPSYLARQVTDLVKEGSSVRVDGLLVSGTRQGGARQGGTQLLEARTISELQPTSRSR